MQKEAFYVILGLRSDFTREVLTIEAYPTETSNTWSDIFKDLKSRGLEKLNLVVSDGLIGIENAVAENFPGTDMQLYVTHLKREMLKQVRAESKLELANDLRYLFETNNENYTHEKAKNRLVKINKKWEKHYPKISDKLISKRIGYYFTYLKYQYSIQSMIYTTNWIERLNKEFKRIINIRNSMPNPDSALALVGTIAIKMTGNKYSYSIYKFKNEKKFKRTVMFNESITSKQSLREILSIKTVGSEIHFCAHYQIYRLNIRIYLNPNYGILLLMIQTKR